jgi:hypothetical protein
MRMKRTLQTISLVAVFALLAACGVDKPSVPDGDNNLILYAIDTSGVDGEGWVPAEEATVKIASVNFEYQATFMTDEEGRVVIENLPAGKYTIMAEKIDPGENIMLLGQMSKTMVYDPSEVDTLYMSYIKSSPIVINEIYYAGCTVIFYYNDQFVELYNSSQDTLYLDGYVLCRTTQVEEVLQDIESYDYALAYYVYQFPGTRDVTKECPIAPGEFQVIAFDAYDHSLVGGNCVDLSNADWETFNATSFDYDNLAVPNIVPITAVGNDFSTNLNHGAIWLSTGEGIYFEEHWDGSKFQDYVHVPLESIVDGVEYDNDPGELKYLTIRVDAGMGGAGNSRYTGLSIERRYPGLDSNNSTFDFEVILATPGYQH